MVDLSIDSRLGQNLGGLLEGRRGQERIRGQGGLCDTQHHLFALGRFLAFGQQLLIHVIVIQHIHGHARKHVAVAALLHFHLL